MFKLMQDSHADDKERQKELDYYKKKLNELSGESIRFDYLLSSLRYELKQRKEGFSILTSLQKEFTVATPLAELFSVTLKAVNTHLGMDRSVILSYDPANDSFQPNYWYGFSPEESGAVETISLNLPLENLKEGASLLLNKSIQPDELLLEIKEKFKINYFVGVPVLHDDVAVAYLIAGRLLEKVPFNQPFNKGDIDTLSAIAALIGSVLQNKNVAELREEMKKQKEENTLVTRMLAELKATQAQLIQSEKMASLGELTAGIAHEIQNPLNFVNNFSDINKELIEEMNEQLTIGNWQEAKEISQDIKENEDKINHHGKRADAIVKSMLQHSRSSNNVKEPTDINALADEYLRLAYHGLRAKDKTFNATLKTDFDKNLSKINIVPQDIGRVILNLITNAFYAVTDKKRKSANGYEPTVTVSSKLENEHLLISVKDNGNGISGAILEKIFQPFFTTKPTGQGTGLGLSLSYDIIKAHGGEMKVETKEGEHTIFIIILPYKPSI